jgi:hypothetical protein
MSSSEASPVSPASGSKSRAQATGELRNATHEINQAIAVIPYLYELAKGLKKGQHYDIPVQSVEGQKIVKFGKSEFSEFIRAVMREVRNLPRKAILSVRSQRGHRPGTGFDTPQQFTQEIVDFFAKANIGPYVRGTFQANESGKMEPDPNSLEVTDQVLNIYLYFTQPIINGKNNPLYGVTSHGILNPLFALHVYYTQQQDPDNRQHLTATDQMRRMLSQTMTLTIQKDIQKAKETYPGSLNELDQLQRQLIQSIQNRNIDLVDQLARFEKINIFNPNHFIYAHFSKLISAARAPKDQQIVKDDLVGLGPEVIEAYTSIGIPFTNGSDKASEDVLSAQRMNISLAKARKNLTSSSDIKERRRLSKKKALQ